MGRPRVALLSRDKIGAAALKLVSRDGDFTMPGLARELGVQVAAVYHHVPAGRSEVIEMVRVLVAQNIDDAAFDRLPWDEAFVVWTRSYLDAFSGHPAAVRLLATEPIRDPDLIAAYNPVAAGLSRAGFVDGGSSRSSPLPRTSSWAPLSTHLPQTLRWQPIRTVSNPNCAGRSTPRRPGCPGQAGFRSGCQCVGGRAARPAPIALSLC